MPRKFKRYMLRFIYNEQQLRDGLPVPGAVWPTRVERTFLAIDDEHARREMNSHLTDKGFKRGSIRRVRLYALTDITKATKKETA